MRYTVRGERWKTGCSSEGEEGGLGTGMMEQSGSMMEREIRAEGEGEVAQREAT